MSHRNDVRFDSHGEECGAWLYTPEEAAPRQQLPVVVMAHGVGGSRAMRLDAYAQKFCDAGYACLVFDYRHFGDSAGLPRELVDIEKQLQDWAAAVAFARTLPGIDPERVVLWGTSFAGGHVMITAADDPCIAAAIAQCPFTDGVASGRAMGLGAMARLAIPAVRDRIAAGLGMARVRIPLIANPGHPGLLTAPDAMGGYQTLERAGGYHGAPRAVPARIALRIPGHVPGRRASEIQCPILFAVCDRDSVTPASATLRHAARAPRGEVKRYDAGHFDIYVGSHFDAAVVDQIAFLAKHVPAPTVPA